MHGGCQRPRRKRGGMESWDVLHWAQSGTRLPLQQFKRITSSVRAVVAEEP